MQKQVRKNTAAFFAYKDAAARAEQFAEEVKEHAANMVPVNALKRISIALAKYEKVRALFDSNESVDHILRAEKEDRESGVCDNEQIMRAHLVQAINSVGEMAGVCARELALFRAIKELMARQAHYGRLMAAGLDETVRSQLAAEHAAREEKRQELKQHAQTLRQQVPDYLLVD
ncbi:MAG: hypothetical protein KGL39_01080 [Patescibacteria group bacterium]|nr:hypothetical protein [Patescibacteria group bacterium]